MPGAVPGPLRARLGPVLEIRGGGRGGGREGGGGVAARQLLADRRQPVLQACPPQAREDHCRSRERDGEGDDGVGGPLGHSHRGGGECHEGGDGGEEQGRGNDGGGHHCGAPQAAVGDVGVNGEGVHLAGADVCGERHARTAQGLREPTVLPGEGLAAAVDQEGPRKDVQGLRVERRQQLLLRILRSRVGIRERGDEVRRQVVLALVPRRKVAV
mmetsp:Transcript_141816/g.440939  ORF Transcript_141816/g.440939 Transcript_141816/m.440939 type:complete len:214 (-) Transcript_141816:841-1482(-)